MVKVLFFLQIILIGFIQDNNEQFNFVNEFMSKMLIGEDCVDYISKDYLRKNKLIGKKITNDFFLIKEFKISKAENMKYNVAINTGKGGFCLLITIHLTFEEGKLYVYPSGYKEINQLNKVYITPWHDKKVVC